MSAPVFHWGARPVAFRPGESLAAALAAAGITGYGPDALGGETRYFCGIGACQGCLVRLNGRMVEACLTPAQPGLQVTPVMNGGASDE